MTSMQDYQKSTTVADPASEPLTVADAKNQCNVGASDTTHDTELTERIAAERSVVENDTQRLTISRAVTEKFYEWPCGRSWRLYWGPVSAITSVKYYDTANAQQTVSSSDYSLDVANKRIVFDWDYVFPVVYDRWDAIEVIYAAGYGSTPASVPGPLKQLIRLRVAYSFEARDMMQNEVMGQNQKAYENLLARYLRSTYP